ncbi:MAG: glutamine synthetase, partial [Sphingomicrobium sp.]
MASAAAKVLKQIEENEVEYVDLRFTDPKGKWQHLTMVASVIDEDMLT